MLGHVRCPQWCLEGLPPVPFPGDLFPFQGCQDGFPSNCAQVPTHVLGRLTGTSCSLSRSCPRVARFNGSSNFFLSQPGWIMHLVSCGSLPPTFPWPRMSVPPIGASICLPLATPSDSMTSSLRKSRRWSLVFFDAPFTPSELRRALTLCFDSAVGIDGLPYSVFKTNLPWWQSAVHHFFNLVLSWGVVPTPWKRSIVVPVFQRGDPSLPTNFRPISLASCCFKIFEHLVHARIGPHISSQLDDCQGGFRWGADSLVGSLVDLLTSRSSSHTFVAFIDIHNAFDTSWVEGTLVRLFDAGMSGQMWKLACWFLPLSSVVRLQNCSRACPFSSLVQSVGERSCCRCATLCTWCEVFPHRGSPPLSTLRWRCGGSRRLRVRFASCLGCCVRVGPQVAVHF